jgi:flagellar biosynthesis/type III secretory pathway protein FliH
MKTFDPQTYQVLLPYPSRVQKDYEEAMKRYGKAEAEARDQFIADTEEAEGMTHWPQELKNKIFRLAWDQGHASGWSEIRNCYGDYVEVAKCALGEQPI